MILPRKPPQARLLRFPTTLERRAPIAFFVPCQGPPRPTVSEQLGGRSYALNVQRLIGFLKTCTTPTSGESGRNFGFAPDGASGNSFPSPPPPQFDCHRKSTVLLSVHWPAACNTSH